TAATSRWETPGTTSTSLRSGVKRSGRTRRRVIPRPRRTSGGSGTTNHISRRRSPFYDRNNNTLLRRMRLRRDSLRIHSRTGDDASLSLSRLPTIQRRSVFVLRDRADGSFQALARFTAFPCLAQSRGWQDPSGLLP